MMREYAVDIVETITRKVTIHMEAHSLDHAKEIAMNDYSGGNIDRHSWNEEKYAEITSVYLDEAAE
jgi:hypothetical protein